MMSIETAFFPIRAVDVPVEHLLHAVITHSHALMYTLSTRTYYYTRVQLQALATVLDARRHSQTFSGTRTHSWAIKGTIHALAFAGTYIRFMHLHAS